MDVVADILSKPAVVGALVSVGLKWVHGLLVSIDKSGDAEKWAPQFHMAFLALSFLASVAEAASTGKLENLNLDGVGTFIEYWVPMLVGGKAMAASHGIPWRESMVKFKNRITTTPS